MSIRTRSSQKTDKLKTGILFNANGFPSFKGRCNRRVGKLWQREVTRYFNSQSAKRKTA